jgi:anti-anti-sigma factor
MIAVKVDHYDRVPVARLPTDVDASNAVVLGNRLAASLSREARDLIVDLTHTRYLDSAGIDMLFRLSRHLDERRARLRVVIATDSHVARLAQIVSLSSAMAVHPDLADALEASSR